MFQGRLHFVSGLFLSLTFHSLGYSQSTFGSITGSVSDPAGAMVAGAVVEVTNEGTGVVRRTSTSSVGVFNVPNLDLGRYTVRVSGQGFTTHERTGLILTANQIINLDVQLALGATTTLVEVQGVSPVIATETHDLSGTVSHEALIALPLVGRQRGDGGIYSYATLVPAWRRFPHPRRRSFRGRGPRWAFCRRWMESQ